MELTETIACPTSISRDFWAERYAGGPVVLTLHIEIPSLNKLIRAHFRRRRALQTAFAWALVAAFGETPPESPGFKVRVLIESFRKSLLDADNLAGGCKLLLDSLKECRFIHDDSPAWIDLEVKQWRVPVHVRTRVTLDLGRGGNS